jgi:hypothetical protein
VGEEQLRELAGELAGADDAERERHLSNILHWWRLHGSGSSWTHLLLMRNNQGVKSPVRILFGELPCHRVAQLLLRQNKILWESS